MTQYYKNITSPIGANAKIQRDNELYKRRSRVTKGKLESWAAGLERYASDGLPMIHASVAHLWSATRRIHKLQALKSGHADLGESELPNEWCGECQVACRNKHACINKSEL